MVVSNMLRCRLTSFTFPMSTWRLKRADKGNHEDGKYLSLASRNCRLDLGLLISAKSNNNQSSVGKTCSPRSSSNRCHGVIWVVQRVVISILPKVVKEVMSTKQTYLIVRENHLTLARRSSSARVYRRS